MVAARLHAQRLRLGRSPVHAGDPVARTGAARRHLRRPARAGAVAVRAVPARPAADPRAAAGPHARARATSTTSRSTTAWPRSCRASRRRSTATTASTPARRSAPAPAARSSSASATRCAFESNVHLHGGFVPAGPRRAPDGRHPAPARSFDYHYPNQQDAATLWYHDHAHGRTSRTLYYGLLAMYVLEDDLERELDLPARRLRRADRDRRPRLQPRRLVPLRREHRRRLPRRHDPRQRRRLPAHARASGAGTACASSTRRTRARTRCGWAAGGR